MSAIDNNDIKKLFAILKVNSEYEVRRIDVVYHIENHILNTLIKEKQNFFTNIENVIDFTESPLYKLEDDQVFVIDDFELNLPLLDYAGNSTPLEVLDPQQFEKVKYIALVDLGTKEIGFIVFNKSFILKPRNKFWMLFVDKNMFTEFDKKALLIPKKMDAVWKDNKLYFKSLRKVTILFGDRIKRYYKEATKDDMEKFRYYFFIEDIPEDFLTSTNRKLIWFIMKYTINETSLDLNRIKEIAENKFGISINITDGKFRIPDNKQDFNKLLKLLNDDLLESPLTQNKYEVNSKRKVS